MMSQFYFPIRVKITGFVAVILISALSIYFWFSSNLILNDKTSYLYDLNLTQLKVTGNTIENKIQKALSYSQSIAPQILTLDANAQEVFQKKSAELGIKSFFLITINQNSQLETTENFIKNSDFSSPTLIKIQSDISFEKLKDFKVIYSKPVSGNMVIVFPIQKNSQFTVFGTFVLSLTNQQLESVSKYLKLQVFDSNGSAVNISEDNKNFFDVIQKNPGFNSLIQNKFESGAKEFLQDNTKFIAAYQKILDGKFTAVGLVDSKVALDTIRILQIKSFIVGLSILLIAIGIALILSRTLTSRIQILWDATQRISSGDFTFHLPLKKLGHDEISDLGKSFNFMNQKIQELLIKTAEKARMENELKTAKLVQESFIPSSDFTNESIDVAGFFLSASECGGDWWYHETVGDHLLLVIGDVTGHGVSAALVTAAAYGAFKSTVRNESFIKGGKPNLKSLADNLNQAVIGAGHGNSGMTAVIAAINLKSKEINYINASHRPILVARKQNESTTITSLSGEISDSLGQTQNWDGPINRDQLLANDLIFLYTDGVIECHNKEQRALGAKGFRKIITEKSDAQVNLNARIITDGIMNSVFDFLGSEKDNRPDDITLLTAHLH